MAVIVVGQRQPKSERLICSRCGALLEYQQQDVRISDAFRYVDCPVSRCKNANYLGTDNEKR